MPVALQRTSRESDNDDGALEQALVAQSVIGYQFILNLPFLTESSVGSFAAAAAKDTDTVDSLQPSDLLGSLQTVHYGQLNIHEYQMEASRLPFCHGFLAVHGSLPADLETLHESAQDAQIDDVVFNDQHIDGRY